MRVLNLQKGVCTSESSHKVVVMAFFQITSLAREGLRSVGAVSLLVAAVFFSGCSKASFGSQGSKKRQAAVDPDALVNPVQPPLDISQIETNQNTDGPVGGEGEVTSRTINLTCETSQGVEINVGEITQVAGNPEPTPAAVPGTTPGSISDSTPDSIPDSTPETLPGTAPGTTPETTPATDPTNLGAEPDPFGLRLMLQNADGTTTEPGTEPLPFEDPVPVASRNRVVTTVKGEFCPQSTKVLTVLFVVDFSGSMGRHVPETGGGELAGNDPQVAGSCGRLRAAQAILERIAKTSQPGDKIQLGMMPFAGGIVTNRMIPITDVASFASKVSKDSFCQYVVQDSSFGYDPANPGGMNGASVGGLLGYLGIGGVDASTNYSAAFKAAQTILTPVYGRKVAYFISDGQPTSGGADPIMAGVAAGIQLRQSVNNLELNGLYLGAPNVAAEDVLAQVAGSVDRVRRAENADDLAKEILSFPDATIDSKSGKAFLTVAPYPKNDLGLQYLNKDGARASIWVYETQPFVLLGTPGKSVLNLVEVTALGEDGTSYRAVVKINYRQ
jgi:hypothetical protein